MLTSKNYYEILSATNNEVLVDGLSFDDMAEQFIVYQQFYGEMNVIPCVRSTATKKYKIISIERAREQAYKREWIDYFEELQEMGNLEWS